MNMKSNLTQEPQGEIVQSPKKEPNTIENFEKGFIMKSRLFHNEVEPFLSNAAKNVYSALMGFINGFHKTSDHISTRQIQGGKLKGSKKLSSETVGNGIKELVWFGVISVLEVNYRIGNKYCINEVSLIDAFEQIEAQKIEAFRLSNKCTSISEAIRLSNSSASISGVASASISEASIDILYIYLPIYNLSRFAQKPLETHFYCFQEEEKQIQLEVEKQETEAKAKAEAERKEKSRKLSFDEVIKLTSEKFNSICDLTLWEQYVSNRSQAAKTKLTKNALNAIYQDFKNWGSDKSNQSLKNSIKSNSWGLFEPFNFKSNSGVVSTSTSRNVNDAWGEPKQYAPVSNISDIDFGGLL